MTTVGSIGKSVTLVISQGVTFIVPFFAGTPDESPIDLTGYQIDSQIRKTFESSDFIPFAVLMDPDPTTGNFNLALSAAATAAIPCGDSLSDPNSQYVWDIFITSPQGFVTKLAQGKVLIYPDVTR